MPPKVNVSKFLPDYRASHSRKHCLLFVIPCSCSRNHSHLLLVFQLALLAHFHSGIAQLIIILAVFLLIIPNGLHCLWVCLSCLSVITSHQFAVFFATVTIKSIKKCANLQECAHTDFAVSEMCS